MKTKFQAANGVSFGEADNKSLDIKICSISNLENYDDPNFETVRKTGHIPPSLTDGIDLDAKFFYSCVQLRCSDDRDADNIFVQQERGVGALYQRGKSVYLRRETPLTRSYPDKETGQMVSINAINRKPLRFTNEDYIVVHDYNPPNYLDALPLSDAVLCSSDPFTAQPVPIDPETVLGRLDGGLEPLDAAELRRLIFQSQDGTIRFSDDELEQITSHINNFLCTLLGNIRADIALRSHAVQVIPLDGRVQSSIFHFDTDYNNNKKPKKPREGYVIYNQDTKSLEVFNGTEWKRIKYENTE